MPKNSGSTTSYTLVAPGAVTGSAATMATAISAPPVPRPVAITTDRRSLRTKRLLRGAFTQLLEQRGLNNFSVSDLTERADINRATFYAHYKDMDDMLGCFEEEIIKALAGLRSKIKSVELKDLATFNLKGTAPAVTVELFDLLREHGVLLKILLGADGDAKFQARLRDHLCAGIVRSVLHHKYTDSPTPLTEYYVSYYASATLGLIQHWLAVGMKEGSEEMARIMLTIMMLKPGEPIKLKGKGE